MPMKKFKSRKFLFSALLLIAVLLFIVFFSHQQTESISEPRSTTVSANPEEHDILAGQTMVAFGDSVTEFGHYPAVVAQNTGMTVHNLGFKGTRLAYHPYSSYDEFSPTKLAEAIITRDFSEQDAAIQENRNYTQAFVDHYEQLKTINFNDVDLVSLLIGTNDYMGNQAGVVSLGQPTDTTRETFTGALNSFVNTFQEAYPHLEFVLITPTWRMNHEDLGGDSAAIQSNARGDYLIDFADTMIERGEHHNIPTLDLYRTSGLNADNHADFFVDHVHPNDEGYELIGNTISQFLIETYNEE